MKNYKIKKILTSILCSVLIAATALFASGCSNTTTESKAESKSESSISSVAESSVAESADSSADVTILGEGATVFYLTVADSDGKETNYEINTDKTTVGEALLDLELIAGNDSDYGLYVTTVNGETLDYDKDGMYWSFYIDGEYASTGVDSTDITAGASYALKAEKA